MRSSASLISITNLLVWSNSRFVTWISPFMTLIVIFRSEQVKLSHIIRTIYENKIQIAIQDIHFLFLDTVSRERGGSLSRVLGFVSKMLHQRGRSEIFQNFRSEWNKKYHFCFESKFFIAICEHFDIIFLWSIRIYFFTILFRILQRSKTIVFRKLMVDRSSDWEHWCNIHCRWLGQI